MVFMSSVFTTDDGLGEVYVYIVKSNAVLLYLLLSYSQ